MEMTFYCDLFISKDFEKKKEKIISRLRANKLQKSVYIITLAQAEQNNLEFYSSALLKQHIYDEMPLFIVGIANGYGDAVAMTEEIVSTAYEATGNVDIRNYILNRQKEFEEGEG